MPSLSTLYRVSISSMPDIDRVSRTAVSETTVLKVVVARFPSPSWPSQSPARDCNFAKAAITLLGLEAVPMAGTNSPERKIKLKRIRADFTIGDSPAHRFQE